MNHALSNIEIDNVLRSDSVVTQYYKGFLFPRDDPKFQKTIKNIKIPSIWIVNTDYQKGPGLHWLLLFYTELRTYFIDSLGLPETIYNYYHLVERKGTPTTRQTLTLQSASEKSYACGHYTILFAFLLARQLDLTEINSAFTRSKTLNDEIVIEWLEDHIETEVAETDRARRRMRTALKRKISS